ncbi:MFS transporter [Bacillus sp. MRMR6]|uniref:MFS transporter n=1 Tax=Bacillus sp. MRMR6 TaxID=1928617 RepID=UPI000A5C27B6|nr:MFS transporter [Bacillus sp. MRMR6]
MFKDTMQMGRPMIVLLLGVLLSHLGSLMVTPMLPIMLKIDAGLTLVQIGAILAGMSISFQFGSIVGGTLADRTGRRFIIGLGALITAGGLIGFGVFNHFYLLVVTAIITGIGNGLYAPSTKAAIAALASMGNRTTAFSMRGIAANIGTASAGLIVFFLITGSSKIIFWIAGFIYIALALISWTLLPKKCGDIPCPPVPSQAYRLAFKNKPFIVFGVVSIFIWVLYAQLALVLPLRAIEILPDPKNVALIWTINSFIVISLQGMITKRIINKIHPLNSLAFGILIVGIGIGSLYFSSSFFHFVISGAIFVMGEMLLLPTIDSTISQLSTAEMIGLFFALANVISGLGEAGGKFAGSKLYEMGNDIELLPWIIYVIMGVILFFVVRMLKRWKPLATSLETAAKKEDKPKEGPKVPLGPTEHQSHPFNEWVPEVIGRKRTRTE